MMLDLDRTLNQERLALQQQYNDKLLASANTTIGGLADYAAKLQTGAY